MHDQPTTVPAFFPPDEVPLAPTWPGALVLVLDQCGNLCFLSELASEAAERPLAELSRGERFWAHLFPETASRERLQALCRRVSAGEQPNGHETSPWGVAAAPCHWTVTRLRAPGPLPAGVLLVGTPSEPVRDPTVELSPRERQVIALLAEGMRTKDIAHRLGLSPRTIDVYRANLMRKLGCHSLVDVLKHALRYAT